MGDIKSADIKVSMVPSALTRASVKTAGQVEGNTRELPEMKLPELGALC